MKTKDDRSMEKIFGDFLELLEKDSEDQYTGFLFNFITEVLAHTMDLGKQGYAPMLNFTMSAKQSGMNADGTSNIEIIFHPTRSTDQETYKLLGLDVLGKKIGDAVAEYGKEVWGMIPVVDVREDLRGNIKTGQTAMAQWAVSYTHLTLPTTPYV